MSSRIVGGVIFAVSLAVAPAQAAVTFDLSTDGCFAVGAGSCSVKSQASLPYLQFNNAQFSDHALSSPVVVPSLGTLSLQNVALWDHSAFGDFKGAFDLQVKFTSPTGVNPNPYTFDAKFSADIDHVFNGETEEVDIKFSQTSQTFTYQGGTFTLKITDPTIDLVLDHSNEYDCEHGDTAKIAGLINFSSGTGGVPSAPEPATWAMMLLGFATVGFVGYRRRSGQAKQALAA